MNNNTNNAKFSAPSQKEIINTHKTFSDSLNNFLLKVRDRAMEQFEYNLANNVKLGHMTVQQAPINAIQSGVVAAINNLGDYTAENAITMAALILEDANCHGEAKPLFDALKE